MLLISKSITGGLHLFPLRFQAPIGTLYSIEMIHIAVIGNGSNTVLFFGRALEEPADFGITEADLLFTVSTSVIKNESLLDMDHKTKYISIGTDGSTAFTAHIFIYGKIIPATISELIWEYVGKKM